MQDSSKAGRPDPGASGMFGFTCLESGLQPGFIPIGYALISTSMTAGTGDGLKPELQTEGPQMVVVSRCAR